ncbi:hypothetical protein GMOD_00006090 [Pyrenophora seminiperda CCB06]|uniref:Uncharacterized protein n=1 Tax=Pyrenophora seminiperda CCB06 TaxID=1302712 RepID=A0A3M7M4K9_9PLEO|nr:hypothetical protein GMOD_00006090 [Pyrenophora seminiperda CCB06]
MSESQVLLLVFENIGTEICEKRFSIAAQQPIWYAIW